MSSDALRYVVHFGTTLKSTAYPCMPPIATSRDALLPVSFYFPGRSPRWVADNCRAGRIPGAFKVGKSWLIRAADVERLATGGSAVTIEDATADLRARGIL